MLRLWAAGATFRNVQRPVLGWREHPGRLSRQDERYAQEAFVRCKVHHLGATLLRGRAALIWGAGPVGKSFARELHRRGHSVAAFVDLDPRKVGRTIHDAPVVPVEEAPRYAEALALGAVSGAEARAQIREAVAAEGRREGVDFVAVA